ncbi:transcriptional regulator, Crp/Fnr family [Faunimonas pinastri]|uniref:Transcriptional regulator, Crp/Fnr family n=1 Tax=Faunimonas pinastri TaxID=1855383 RepID=A0A1H9IIA2_9HYPH|nr:Crp/Fnr family transcriptional regulator [Faunimonas pinastri]SEQ74304.1 transcriptional regulator, Crp/Fnr family [Faunimonas pinastri]
MLQRQIMDQPMTPVRTEGTLLAGLGPEALKALSARSVQRTFAANAHLFHQGDLPTHLFQVCTGLVKVVQISAGGAQTTLHIMGPGELIGCLAVVQQFPFPASAVASQDTVVLSWPAPQLRDLMNQFPSIAANVLREVGARAQEMADRVVDMLHKDVEQRIAGVLLRLSSRVGEVCEQGVRLDFPITRKDVGELAGATYFTVSRTLGEWQKQGIVCTGRERIMIVAPDRLAQIAGGSSFASG